MATITHRGPYQYQAVVRRKGHPQQTKTFESREEAKAWARSIESKIDVGTFKDRREIAKITLHQALQRYVEEVTVHKRAPQNEINRIAALQRLPMAQKSMEELRSIDFDNYARERIKSVSGTTVRLELAVLSHLYTVAKKRWKWPLEDEFKDVTKPKPNKGRKRRLSNKEFEELMKSVHRPEARSTRIWLDAAIRLALETGMRSGEVLSVQWSDVELDNRIIRLDRTKNDDERIVPLSLEAVRILKSLPRKGSRVIAGFHDVNGMGKALRNACQHAGVKNFRFHDLRHEAASRFAPHMNVQNLAKLMGWRVLQMAMRYYNPSKKDLVELRDRVNAPANDPQASQPAQFG